MLIHNILKAVAIAHSGCNERTNEDLCWLLIVVRNEKLHIFVTCVGIDSLESHQTQRFYCWRWAQVWCSSQQQEHWQVSNFPLLWCPNNEVFGLVVVQFRIIVQNPWMDVPYAVLLVILFIVRNAFISNDRSFLNVFNETRSTLRVVELFSVRIAVSD